MKQPVINMQLRLPIDVRDWVAAQAAANQRSQNAQIAWVLRQSMEADGGAGGSRPGSA
jgi:hypothetical protein